MFKSLPFRLNLLFLITTVLTTLSFWIGIYFLRFELSITFSVILVVISALFLIARFRSTWAAINAVICVSVALGFVISVFFVVAKMPADLYFNLELLIMLAAIFIVGFVARLIKKTAHKTTFLMFLVVLETLAAICFGLAAFNGNPHFWQIMFASLLSIIYTFGLFFLSNANDKFFLRKLALCYVFGLVGIVITIVVLIISIASEDGSPFESFAEIIAAGLNNDLSQTEKKKPPIIK